MVAPTSSKARKKLTYDVSATLFDPQLSALKFDSSEEIREFFSDKDRIRALQSYILENVEWGSTFPRQALKIILSKPYRREYYFQGKTRQVYSGK